MASVPSNSIAVSQTTVTTSAVQIAPARADRKRLTIVNGAAILAIGASSSVTTGNGAPLAANGTITLETTAAVYGITGTSSTVGIIEEFA